MSAFPPGNTPLIVLRTGAVGYIEFATVVVYVAALIVYYAGPYLYADADSYSTIFNVFYIWAALKPVLPVMAAIYTALQVYVLGPIIAYLIVAGIIAVGSLALFITLIADFGRCNTVLHPSLACNDPLYCCAFWNETSACAGFGPCNGTSVDSPGDLQIAENHLWLTWFTLGLFVLEVLLGVLAYLVFQRRLIKKQQADILIEEAIRDKYGAGAVPPGGIDAVATPEGEAGEETFDATTPINMRIGSSLSSLNSLGTPLSDGMRMRHYREQHRLPYWQARAHATFDWLDDWLDWGRFQLEHHVHQSIGAALVRHEYSDTMAAHYGWQQQWYQQQQQQQQHHHYRDTQGGREETPIDPSRPYALHSVAGASTMHHATYSAYPPAPSLSHGPTPLHSASIGIANAAASPYAQHMSSSPPSHPNPHTDLHRPLPPFSPPPVYMTSPPGPMLDALRHVQFEEQQQQEQHRARQLNLLIEHHQQQNQQESEDFRNDRDWPQSRNERQTMDISRRRRR